MSKTQYIIYGHRISDDYKYLSTWSFSKEKAQRLLKIAKESNNNNDIEYYIEERKRD